MTKFMVDLMDRKTGAVEVSDYASFDSCAEAVAFSQSHEMEFRGCGWTGVVRMASVECVSCG